MAKEPTLGKMEENMKESILMTRSKVSESTTGLMAEDMKENGSKANNMAMENTTLKIIL